MDNIFKLEQITHAALAQYYRWYQVYEVPFTQQTISNQKDILSEEVEIVSQNGITKGKDGLEERLCWLAKRPSRSKNSGTSSRRRKYCFRS